MKTTELKDALSLLTSIITKNSIKPITELVQLHGSNNKLSLGMTDNITKIALQIDCIDALDTIVLDVEQLFKLTKLTTKEYIKIDIKDGIVVIKGNGTYKQAIKTDEMNDRLLLSITFPQVAELYDIDLSVFKTVLNRNKISLLVGEDHPELYRYYTDDNYTITSDSNTIAITNISTKMQDIVELYPAVVVDLANLNCKAKYGILNNIIYVQADGLYYSTIKLKDNLFPIDEIEPFITIKDDMDVSFKISKKEIKESIKRLDIFDVTVFDTPAVCLTNRDGYVILSDTKGRAEEETGIKISSDFSIKLATATLLKLISVMEEDITIYIGDGVAVLEDSVGQYIVSEA